MSRLYAAGFAATFALAIVAFSAPLMAMTDPNEPTAKAAMVNIDADLPSAIDGVPLSALPDQGQCRIWYDALPEDKQPAPMECEHADWIARQWGGRMIAHNAELARYDGRNDFSGVALDETPRPGYCRAVIDGMRTSDSDCVMARQQAAAHGGRVLFMPL